MMAASSPARQRGKRHGQFNDTQVAQSLKRLRILEAQSLPTDVANRHDGVTGSGLGKEEKKRVRANAQEGSTASAAGKRSKSANSSNAGSVSLHSTAAASEAFITSEGLEKGPARASEQAYRSQQQQKQHEKLQQLLQHKQQHGGHQQQWQHDNGNTPADRVSLQGGALDVTSRICQKDATKGHTGKDQAPNRSRQQQPQGRQGPRQATSQAVGSSSMDARRHAGVQPDATGQQHHDSKQHKQQDVGEQHVHVQLVQDKEWQRLFAVLSIQATESPNCPNGLQQQQQHSSRCSATSSSTYGTATAASTSGVVQHAGRSFLANEFTRVQQQQLQKCL